MPKKGKSDTVKSKSAGSGAEAAMSNKATPDAAGNSRKGLSAASVEEKSRRSSSMRRIEERVKRVREEFGLHDNNLGDIATRGPRGTLRVVNPDPPSNPSENGDTSNSVGQGYDNESDNASAQSSSSGREYIYGALLALSSQVPQGNEMFSIQHPNTELQAPGIPEKTSVKEERSLSPLQDTPGTNPNRYRDIFPQVPGDSQRHHVRYQYRLSPMTSSPGVNQAQYKNAAPRVPISPGMYPAQQQYSSSQVPHVIPRASIVPYQHPAQLAPGMMQGMYAGHYQYPIPQAGCNPGVYQTQYQYPTPPTPGQIPGMRSSRFRQQASPLTRNMPQPSRPGRYHGHNHHNPHTTQAYIPYLPYRPHPGGTQQASSLYSPQGHQFVAQAHPLQQGYSYPRPCLPPIQYQGHHKNEYEGEPEEYDEQYAQLMLARKQMVWQWLETVEHEVQRIEPELRWVP
ncbi:hypothetical protein LOZ12_004527 [Ophidiomyces ophidiicola]|uniref:Uncharacterized protein n=1 Tax=Ophidiomyces ophidiicola TaxID=1387563 RepID=A0ACB8V2T4_9EURO|nr:hypothetical protein LOZ64_004803 [Ophidiomyces ophidiicola]KAI1954721.1 hypothetical protein LOZ62_000736 [Ophidiomyces ophidiicola]KAI1973441.1 hypothetical protein LOZ56_001879 [Ophidiomyces ophidiicola]KAI2007621.1 hypothetical protein LOZ50_002497 [Ophidiomyces ophidiicola]KAI2019591.1 hypothetical protein LOZ46_003232 [Ophidiomyces ophidiicola]